MLTVDAFKILEPADCERIIRAGLASPKMRPGYMKNSQGEDYVAASVRQSNIAFLSADEIGEPVAMHLVNEVLRLNSTLYHVDLSGEFQFQFASYDGAAGDFINWHPDEPMWDGHYRGKKLSLVVQLSDPADYDGGVLELRERSPTPKGQGLAILFPSFYWHRVTPVTRGARYSLVVWAHGPHWR